MVVVHINKYTHPFHTNASLIAIKFLNRKLWLKMKWLPNFAQWSNNLGVLILASCLKIVIDKSIIQY